MFGRFLGLSGWILLAITGFYIKQLQTLNATLHKQNADMHAEFKQWRKELLDRPCTVMQSSPLPIVMPSAKMVELPKSVAAALPPRQQPGESQQVREARKRIAEIEARLNQLNGENAIVDQRSKDYQRGVDGKSANQIADLKIRLLQIDAQQVELDNQKSEIPAPPKSNAQKESLRQIGKRKLDLVRQKEAINVQIQALITKQRTQDDAIRREVTGEKDEYTCGACHPSTRPQSCQGRPGRDTEGETIV